MGETIDTDELLRILRGHIMDLETILDNAERSIARARERLWELEILKDRQWADDV